MAELSVAKIEEMIDLCDKMLDKSYCIYSKFPVAAVLMTECGKLISGKLSGCSHCKQIDQYPFTQTN